MGKLMFFKNKAKIHYLSALSPQNGYPKLSYWVYCLQGKGSRSCQEDSYAVVNGADVRKIIENGLLAIIADGMGGIENGTLASSTTIDSISYNFNKFDMTGDIAFQLEEAVSKASKTVFERCCHTGGSTAVLILIYNERMWWSNVGDSSLFLYRDAKLIKLSCDQDYINMLVGEQINSGEQINKSVIDFNTDGHRLSRYIGMEKLGEIEISLIPLKIKKEDIIMLCSDGVTDTLTADKIVKCLEHTPPEACGAIEKGIKDTVVPWQDNYTAIVIMCGN